MENFHLTSTSLLCFEERFGTIYTVEKTNGQNIYLKNEDGTIINKFFKPYQLLKVNYVEKYEKPTDEEHEKEHKETLTKRKQDNILKADLTNIVEGKRERKPKKIFYL